MGLQEGQPAARELRAPPPGRQPALLALHALDAARDGRLHAVPGGAEGTTTAYTV